MFAKFHSRALFGFLVTHLMLLANQLLIYGRPALIHSFARASPIRRRSGVLSRLGSGPPLRSQTGRFPGADNVRGRSQGLGTGTDLSAPRIGVLANLDAH